MSELEAGAEDAELAAWRSELRGWLAQNIPPWWKEEFAATPFEIPERRFNDMRNWQRALFDAGYYLDRNADVRADVAAGSLRSGVWHYIHNGAAEH